MFIQLSTTTLAARDYSGSSMATLPAGVMMAAATISAAPGSLLMMRVGRKPVLLFSATAGIVGGVLMVLAARFQLLWLLIVGSIPMGVCFAQANNLRFAATEFAPAGSEPKALSLVVTGAVLSSVVGPEVSRHTRQVMQPPYIATYIFVTGLCLSYTLLIAVIEFGALPSLAEEKAVGGAAAAAGVAGCGPAAAAIDADAAGAFTETVSATEERWVKRFSSSCRSPSGYPEQQQHIIVTSASAGSKGEALRVSPAQAVILTLAPACGDDGSPPPQRQQQLIAHGTAAYTSSFCAERYVGPRDDRHAFSIGSGMHEADENTANGVPHEVREKGREKATPPAQRRLSGSSAGGAGRFRNVTSSAVDCYVAHEQQSQSLRSQIFSWGYAIPVLTASLSYSGMAGMMAASPLAIQDANYNFDEATQVIQVHIIAMFLPSLVTGDVICRITALWTMTLGSVMLLCGTAIFFAGGKLAVFFAGNAIVGLGWNWAYVGASAMVTSTYTPDTRFIAQGVMDSAVLFGTGLSVVLAGTLYSSLGWMSYTAIFMGCGGMMVALDAFLLILLKQGFIYCRR